MLQVDKSRRGLLAGMALLVTGCANESVRLHDAATRAMVAAGQLEKERRDIAAQPRSTAILNHAHPTQRWMLSYPGDWTLTDDGQFVRLSRGQAVLGIHVLPDVAGRSIDAVADAAVQAWERRMQAVNSVRRVSRQRQVLPGDLTAIAVVHHIGIGQVGKSLKLVVLVQGRGFLIDAETHLASWPDYEADFNRIIDSFRVLP